MNCPYCGFLCDDGSRFCPSCGKQMTAEGMDFEQFNTMPQVQPVAAPSHSEMLLNQAEERVVKKFKGLLVLALFLALALLAGAVYMVAFVPKNKTAEEPAVSETDTVVLPALVGSWVNDSSYLVMTASGKFACDGVSGTYTSDGEAVIFSGEETVYAEYTVSDGDMTLVRKRLGEEYSYTFHFVTERTDLTYSELLEMYKSMGN